MIKINTYTCQYVTEHLNVVTTGTNAQRTCEFIYKYYIVQIVLVKWVYSVKFGLMHTYIPFVHCHAIIIIAHSSKFIYTQMCSDSGFTPPPISYEQ